MRYHTGMSPGSKRIVRDGILVIIGLAIVLWAIGIIRLPKAAPKGEPQPPLRTVEMRVNDALLTVEIAETREEQEKGLAFRPALGPNEGMLFWYNSPRPRSLWVYGIDFPVDMVFIRGNRVVDYQENIPPPSKTWNDPAVVTTLEDTDAVLHLLGGRAAALDIRIGTEVEILKNP